MSTRIHILGSGNAGKKHREAIETMPELYTITDYDDADIIDICTPNYLHFAQATAALMSGKDCIVEKPVCGSMAEFDSLLELQIDTGKRIHPVLQYRNLELDSYDFVWHRPIDYYSGCWRGRKDCALGGVLMSHGIHFIDHAIQRHGAWGANCAVETDTRFTFCEVETTARVELLLDSGGVIKMSFAISPDAPTKAPPNPGYDQFLRNLQDYTLESHEGAMCLLIDECYGKRSPLGTPVVFAKTG